MEEVAYMLVNNATDQRYCEKLLNDFSSRIWYRADKDMKTKVLLYYFLTKASNIMFRRLFHVNRETISRICREIKNTKTFKLSSFVNSKDEVITEFVCFSVLYINSCLSLRSCSLFCGISSSFEEIYINLFNKMMNEVRDKVICFPALNYQNLLRVNSKHFFPGAVGVVGTRLASLSLQIDTVFVPKLFSAEEAYDGASGEPVQQGIKLLIVIGRDGRFFNLHISENGNQSNCKIFNESALGYTLRFHKRTVLNRGSFLIADRSYPELPYIQIPFSCSEIKNSKHPSNLSNYNYWHHKARFIAERSIQRWLYRSPRCRLGLPFTSSRSCILFVISSLVLNQMCQSLGDEWVDNDSDIQCVVIASLDGRDVEGVNEECYKIYDAKDGSPSFENDYYDLNMVSVTHENAEVVDESLANSTYERLKVVARKRRDFLVELVNRFHNRSVVFYDDWRV